MQIKNEYLPAVWLLHQLLIPNSALAGLTFQCVKSDLLRDYLVNKEKIYLYLETCQILPQDFEIKYHKLLNLKNTLFCDLHIHYIFKKINIF